MSQRDPKREFAVDVVERLRRAGHTALWAGGCVRDFLLGREPQDYDVATDAQPRQVCRLFGRGRTLTVGASFGVVVVLGPKAAGNVEVATFRTEGPYLDGRHPEHVSFSTPEEDARRRDFTINGMFYDPVEERALDFVGGEQDLKERIVRAIGSPHDRMREDKLRMLRAIRFAATLDFVLDESTATAIREMAEQIHVVSAERIAHELRRMLVDAHRRRAIELASDTGLLAQVLPELTPLLDAHGKPSSPSLAGGELAADEPPQPDWDTTLQMLQHLDAPRFELAAAVLFRLVEWAASQAPQPADLPDTSLASGCVPHVRAICRRLRLSNHETDDICWLVSHQDDLADAQSLPLPALKRLLSHRLGSELRALTRATELATTGQTSSAAFCEDYLRDTPRKEIDPPPLITGADLIARGFPPGPQFKRLLDTIRDAQLNGEIRTPREALEIAERLQAEEPVQQGTSPSVPNLSDEDDGKPKRT